MKVRRLWRKKTAALLFASFGMGQGQKEGTEAGYDSLSRVLLSLPSLGRGGRMEVLTRQAQDLEDREGGERSD